MTAGDKRQPELGSDSKLDPEPDFESKPAAILDDPWAALRRLTSARIGLGRTGDSLPTAALLAFKLAHAQARDSVHQALDVPALQASLDTCGFTSIQVRSAASDRAEYLRRPDLGRRLDPAAAKQLDRVATPDGYDMVFVLADGLSARAAAQMIPLLENVVPALPGWRIAPMVVATQARVALGDEIGERLRAGLVAVLIGERPGLSSPDSLGVYLTHSPKVGCSDAERNCISNIRPGGLSFEAAAFKLSYLLNAARRLGRTGIDLKDDSDAQAALPM